MCVSLGRMSEKSGGAEAEAACEPVGYHTATAPLIICISLETLSPIPQSRDSWTPVQAQCLSQGRHSVNAE